MYLLIHRRTTWWSSERTRRSGQMLKPLAESQHDLRSHHHVVLGRAPPHQRFEAPSRLPIELHPVLSYSIRLTPRNRSFWRTGCAENGRVRLLIFKPTLSAEDIRALASERCFEGGLLPPRARYAPNAKRPPDTDCPKSARSPQRFARALYRTVYESAITKPFKGESIAVWHELRLGLD
jgi:hypothetical protein